MSEVKFEWYMNVTFQRSLRTIGTRKRYVRKKKDWKDEMIPTNLTCIEFCCSVVLLIYVNVSVYMKGNAILSWKFYLNNRKTPYDLLLIFCHTFRMNFMDILFLCAYIVQSTFQVIRRYLKNDHFGPADWPLFDKSSARTFEGKHLVVFMFQSDQSAHRNQTFLI